jgi:hypothetical protein
MQDVVDDGDQGVVRHLDAGGARALVQGLVEFLGQAGVGAQPALAGRVREVEVEPGEAARFRLFHPRGGIGRIDLARGRAVAHHEAPDQARNVGPVAERRCRHMPPHPNEDAAL